MLSFPSQLDRPGVVEKTDSGDGKSLAFNAHLYFFHYLYYCFEQCLSTGRELNFKVCRKMFVSFSKPTLQEI